MRLGVALSAAAVLALGGSAAAAGVVRDRPAARSVVAAVPGGNCTYLSHSPNEVRRCGDCTVIKASSAAARDQEIGLIASKSNNPVWFAVGSDWYAGDDAMTFSGALDCQAKLGGFIGRYGG